MKAKHRLIPKKRAGSTAKSSHATENPGPNAWRLAAMSLLLVVLVIALYASVGSHPFANYDDPEYVTGNEHVKAGLHWSTVAWAFTAFDASNWHPMTWLSHALDCQLWGLDPAGHHWTNVGIHAINVVLILWLLAGATGEMGKSFAVAALFAVHPLNVESVAWIAERKNVLSMFFFLGTLAAYGWYVRQPSLRRYVLVGLLFVLGLMAKPMLVTVPFVLLLLDFWPLRRMRNEGAIADSVGTLPGSKLLLEKIPLLCLSAASAVVTVLAQRPSLATAERFPFGLRVTNAIYSCVLYLQKTVWPVRLALFYPHPASLTPWQWAKSAILLVAISWMVWRTRNRRPSLLMGWLWFLGTLVPVLGLVQVGAQGMADRYAYLPLLGIFVAVVWGVDLPARGRKVVAVVVVSAFSFLTWRQIGFWKTNEELWAHAIEVTGSTLVAEDKLAVALQSEGRQEDAIVHFTRAAQIEPLDPLSNFSLGADLQWHGRLREAVPHYEIAIQHTTDSRLKADAYQNLATDYLQIGDALQARAKFVAALQADPQLVTAFAGLGEVAGEPVRSLAQAVVERPASGGYLQLAEAFHRAGFDTEARLALAQALAIDPALAHAQITQVTAAQ